MSDSAGGGRSAGSGESELVLLAQRTFVAGGIREITDEDWAVLSRTNDVGQLGAFVEVLLEEFRRPRRPYYGLSVIAVVVLGATATGALILHWPQWVGVAAIVLLVPTSIAVTRLSAASRQRLAVFNEWVGAIQLRIEQIRRGEVRGEVHGELRGEVRGENGPS